MSTNGQKDTLVLGSKLTQRKEIKSLTERLPIETSEEDQRQYPTEEHINFNKDEEENLSVSHLTRRELTPFNLEEKLNHSIGTAWV